MSSSSSSRTRLPPARRWVPDDHGADLPRGIGAPATRALTAAVYTPLEQLAGVPERQLGGLHGVGPEALRILREALREQGMSFG